MRVICCPGAPPRKRYVPLGIYVRAIKAAKANPSTEFKHGLTTWWPTSGAEIMRQFRQGMNDRINRAQPAGEVG